MRSVFICAVLSLLIALPALAFETAEQPRAWSFPADHGSHPNFETEWWYFTGSLRNQEQRHFGYELTFFRVALAEELPAGSSAWRARDLMLIHVAITDVDGNYFLHETKSSRMANGIAGSSTGALKLWAGAWRAETVDQGFELNASGDDWSLHLKLEPEKAPVLHGLDGLSSKGNSASYYYSMPRLATLGTLAVNGTRYIVDGDSWMDHEFFSGDTPADGLGWDWFGLRFEDGRDLMLYRVRDAAGDATVFGTFVERDGGSRAVRTRGISMEPLARWTSPDTGNVYPTAWRIVLPDEEAEFEVRAFIAPQEIDARSNVGFAYWEGLSHTDGKWNGLPIQGEGYVELTGYGPKPNSR